MFHPRVHQFALEEASTQLSTHLRGLHRLVRLPPLHPGEILRAKCWYHML
jgi:hypothetical protein